MDVGVSTHSRPKAAAPIMSYVRVGRLPFQHTAARRRLHINITITKQYQISFNTQPPEGGCLDIFPCEWVFKKFQHTAARRRLPNIGGRVLSVDGFNTQPPEGGCRILSGILPTIKTFQHTAARRRLLSHFTLSTIPK